MPNWCENTLTVTGDEKELKRFKEQAKRTRTTAMNEVDDSSDLSLNSLIRRPAKEKDNWYGWNIENWGTKWDIEAELVADEVDFLQYEFLSAWSPPTNWLEKVTTMYPKLNFTLKYDEPGMAFMGVASGEEGVFVDNVLDY